MKTDRMMLAPPPSMALSKGAGIHATADDMARDGTEVVRQPGGQIVDIVVPPAALFLREDVIRGGMDLLFFAHTRHVRRVDEELARRGLGRAHHRALYFLARKPDISVGELLTILGVTKQSFNRVAKELTAQILLVQRPGDRDRRQRLMNLTPEGKAFERMLFMEMHAGMARAFAASGGGAVAGYWTVMQHLMGEEALVQFQMLNGQFTRRG